MINNSRVANVPFHTASRIYVTEDHFCINQITSVITMFEKRNNNKLDITHILSA